MKFLIRRLFIPPFSYLRGPQWLLLLMFSLSYTVVIVIGLFRFLGRNCRFLPLSHGVDLLRHFGILNHLRSARDLEEIKKEKWKKIKKKDFLRGVAGVGGYFKGTTKRSRSETHRKRRPRAMETKAKDIKDMPLTSKPKTANKIKAKVKIKLEFLVTTWVLTKVPKNQKFRR